MIKQLAHICIHSRNLSETERFYCGALGLGKGFDFIRKGALFGFYLKLGANTFVEVFEGEPGGPGNINHFAIEVDDIDAVLERVKSHGFEAGGKKLGADQSWQAWLEDPDGVRIELHQYTADSLQLRGGTCEVNW
jgi:catechol 2,3-dioxygenase-like lactoylglutathione lyase family enzyme